MSVPVPTVIAPLLSNASNAGRCQPASLAGLIVGATVIVSSSTQPDKVGVIAGFVGSAAIVASLGQDGRPLDLSNYRAADGAVLTQPAQSVASIPAAPDSVAYDLGTELVTVGACSVSALTSKISVTGTKAYTLADGLYVNQAKLLVCTVAASTPAGTLTPATPIGFATLAFSAVGQTATLRWTGAGWVVMAVNGTAIA